MEWGGVGWGGVGWGGVRGGEVRWGEVRSSTKKNLNDWKIIDLLSSPLLSSPLLTSPHLASPRLTSSVSCIRLTLVILVQKISCVLLLSKQVYEFSFSSLFRNSCFFIYVSYSTLQCCWIFTCKTSVSFVVNLFPLSLLPSLPSPSLSSLPLSFPHFFSFLKIVMGSAALTAHKSNQSKSTISLAILQVCTQNRRKGERERERKMRREKKRRGRRHNNERKERERSSR